MTILDFQKVAPALAKLIAAGATLPVACRALGISEGTVRGWVRKGRINPNGTYGAFAAAVDAAKPSGVAPFDASGQMTREEWEQHLAEAVRAGSVQAMKLWSDTHPQDSEKPVEDVFGFVDELAERRRSNVK